MDRNELSTLITPLQVAWRQLFSNELSLVDQPSDATSIMAAPISSSGQEFGWLQATFPSDQPDLAHSLMSVSANLLSKLALERYVSQHSIEALSAAWDGLSLLHQIPHLMRDVRDPWQLSLRSLKLAGESLSTQSGFVIQIIADKVKCRWTYGMPYDSQQMSLVIEQLKQTHSVVICNEASGCPAIFSRLEGLLNYMGKQLEVTNAPPTFIGLINREQQGFNASDRQLFDSLAELLASAIEIEALHQRQIRTEHLNHELAVAAAVQSSFLPTHLPELDGFELATTLIPAAQIGGDFYDVVQDDKGGTKIFVCDITGKGISAALLAAHVRAIVHSELRVELQPGHLMRRINSSLFEEFSRNERFATAALATMSSDQPGLYYASAGHTSAMWVKSSPLTVERLPSTTLPLGIVAELDDTTRLLDLQDEDVLVMYSDGLTEAENAQGQILGMGSLEDMLLAVHSTPAPFIMESLLALNEQHRGGALLGDDLTLLVIKKTTTNAVDFSHLEGLVLEATLGCLPMMEQALERLRSHLPRNEIGTTWLLEVQLAVTEGISNIVRHAYDGNVGRIFCSIAIYRNQLQVHIIDSGRPYQPAAAPELEPDPHALLEHGYGLAVINQVMDDVTYFRLQAGQNHWQLIRRLPGEYNKRNGS